MTENPRTAYFALPKGRLQVGGWLTAPLTFDERLRRIEVIGQQINGYIQFMTEVGSLSGSSAEAKERVVTTFYDRLVIVEKQLGRIREDFQLE